MMIIILSSTYILLLEICILITEVYINREAG